MTMIIDVNSPHFLLLAFSQTIMVGNDPINTILAHTSGFTRERNKGIL